MPPDPVAPKKPAESPTLEQRIAALVQSNTSRDDSVQRLLADNQALTTQVSQIAATLNQFVSRPPAATPTVSPGNPFVGQAGVTTATAAPLDAASLSGLIAGIVGQALKPVVDRLENHDARTALQRAHAASMAKATKELAALRDHSSTEFQVFERIWDGRPDLQELEDGPYVAALVARGVLAGHRTERADVSARKVQASVTPSRAPRQFASAPTEGSFETAVEKQKSLAAAGAERGLDESGFAELIKLSLATDITRQLGGEQKDDTDWS